eukprot:1160656-Pelagomonas_calceolata.AAC.15
MQSSAPITSTPWVKRTGKKDGRTGSYEGAFSLSQAYVCPCNVQAAEAPPLPLDAVAAEARLPACLLPSLLKLDAQQSMHLTAMAPEGLSKDLASRALQNNKAMEHPKETL